MHWLPNTKIESWEFLRKWEFVFGMAMVALLWMVGVESYRHFWRKEDKDFSGSGEVKFLEYA